MKKAIWIAGLAAMILAVQTAAWAKPTAEAMKPFQKQLAVKVRVKLIEATLEKALDFFIDECDVPIVIDYDGLRSRMDTHLTIRGDDVPLQSLLDWICRMARIDYDVRDGMLFITTMHSAIKERMILHIYDVRSLTIEPQDMPGPNIELTSGEADVSISTFDDGGCEMDPEALKELIQCSVTPALWVNDDSVLGIEVQAGKLIVTAPQETHDRILELLTEMRGKQSKMVSLDARLYLADSALVRKFMKDLKKDDLILTAEETEKVFDLFASSGAAVEQVSGIRNVCFNNQRTHAMAVTQNSYVRDITPVIAQVQAGVDPEIDTWTSGNVLDLRPTVSFDDSWIYCELRATRVRGEEPGLRSVPVGTETLTAGLFCADINSNAATGPQSSDGTTMNMVGKEPTKIDIDLPSVDVVRFRTNVRVPNRGGVILSGSDAGLHDPGIKGKELVFVLKAAVSR